MKFYHGSMVKRLKELHPHLPVGAHIQEPLVYLTSSRQLALHYIWDTERLGVKMPMIHIREDGVFVFQEMFPNALEYFYKGVSGYLYHCEGDFTVKQDSYVPTCVITGETVPIIDCEYIENVYETILGYAEQGRLIYEHYEDLPQWRKDVIRGHITRFIKRNNLLNDPAHPSKNFISEKFPEYWAEAKVLSEHDLF